MDENKNNFRTAFWKRASPQRVPTKGGESTNSTSVGECLQLRGERQENPSSWGGWTTASRLGERKYLTTREDDDELRGHTGESLGISLLHSHHVVRASALLVVVLVCRMSKPLL